MVELLLRDYHLISRLTFGFKRLVKFAVVWWNLIVELQNLVYLFEARLKIQHNFIGLIPEFANVVDDF